MPYSQLTLSVTHIFKSADRKKVAVIIEKGLSIFSVNGGIPLIILLGWTVLVVSVIPPVMNRLKGKGNNASKRSAVTSHKTPDFQEFFSPLKKTA